MAIRAILIGLFCFPAFLASQDAPLLWLKLDEGSGTTIGDAQGRFKGELKGAQWTAGRSGKALEVNGTNAYARIPFTNLPGSFTFSVWTKPQDASNANVGGEASIMARTGFHNSLGYDAWRRFYFNIWQEDQKTNPMARASSESVPGTWYHVVGVYDKEAGKLFTYVNGEMKGSVAMAMPPRAYEPVLFLGTGSTGGKYSFGYHGIVDDVKVFARALSAEEIKAAFNAQK